MTANSTSRMRKGKEVSKGFKETAISKEKETETCDSEELSEKEASKLRRLNRTVKFSIPLVIAAGLANYFGLMDSMPTSFVVMSCAVAIRVN
eukprot:CAMPEP_0196589502 /NCGR_PEP_ID=MMETSP1081-20130531/63727_1 /TAXON_ID=36882 /ORGANISM="Pyramimonas amylifera, Strain CCMP720" /LENGTH=91 /DNA_ID=CAMNT_0041912321 /DNA_START=147 /DNA_END=419 /DNA_ORIENTATION=+